MTSQRSQERRTWQKEPRHSKQGGGWLTASQTARSQQQGALLKSPPGTRRGSDLATMGLLAQVLQALTAMQAQRSIRRQGWGAMSGCPWSP